MADKKTTKKYSYTDFAYDAIRLVEGEELSVDGSIFIEKAEAFIAAQERKAEYNRTNPKKSAKGASETTKEVATKLEEVLTAEPQTSTELATAMGMPGLTPLNISNAMKFVNVQVVKTKVVRETVNGKGLRGDKEYTAYALA